MKKIVYFVGFIASLFVFSPIPVRTGVCQRSITEYLLPKTEQTHEIMLVPGKNVLLITQYSNSKFLKAKISPDTGDIVGVEAFLIGNPTSGLHGLASSATYPGQYWVSLQIDNKILRLNPKANDIMAKPKILQTILVPSPGNGPHHIAEYGTNIWATLKDSEHILRFNYKDPQQGDYQLFKTLPAPVFLAQHPVSKDIYAGEYKANSILRINTKENTMSRIPVPANVGESPVGIVSNSKFTWVALLSIKSRGTGGFGKIYANGTIQWFRLKTAIGRKAALLHIAFNPEEVNEARPRVWLLSSSVEDPEAFDMIIKTNFDKGFEHFDREQVAFLPSQGIKAHRAIASPLGFYVTELTSSRVAFYKRTRNDSTCNFNFMDVVVNNEDGI